MYKFKLNIATEKKTLQSLQNIRFNLKVLCKFRIIKKLKANRKTVKWADSKK